MAQDAELKLKVSLDLAFFRQQLSTVGAQLGGQSIQLNVQFNKKSIADQYRLLDRYVRGKKFNVELNLIGGLTKNEFEKIKGRLDDLRDLRKVEIPIGIKNGATGKDVDKVVSSIKERIGNNQQIKQGGGKLRIEASIKPSVTNQDIADLKKAAKDKLSKIGALEIATKLEIPKVEDLLKALQKNLNRQKPLLVKTSIKPSILRADVQAFKKAVEEKLSGITVKINAELATVGGGKTKAQIEKEVLAGLERIQQMGAERMGGGVTEAARRESLRQSLQGRDIEELRGIGAQLGVSGVGRFRNAQNLIEKIVTESSIEMIKKYLDPQAVMRNPDRSGLNKVLDTFARGLFNMLGMDVASMRQQVAQRRALPGINFPATIPSRAVSIGPSATGRALPAGRSAAGMIGAAQAPVGLLPSITRRSSIQAGIENIFAAGGPRFPEGVPGKLALSTEALQERVNAQLAEYFKVVEAKVREVFNPQDLKRALNIFSYLPQALRDAEARTRQARVGIPSAQGIAGLLPAAQGRAPSTYSTGAIGGESREQMMARRTAEAYARSALRGMDVMGGGAGRPPSPYSYAYRSARPTSAIVPYEAGGAMVPSPVAAGAGGRGTAPSSQLPPGYHFLGTLPTNLERAQQFLNQRTLPLTSAIKDLAGEFGHAAQQVLLYGTAYKALAFFTSLPGQAFEAAKGLETFRNQLAAVTDSTGQFGPSLKFIENSVKELNIPIESAREGFTRLFASLQPAGFDPGTIQNLFGGITKAAATFGLSADEVDRVFYAFGQMASKGQVMSEELKGQLGDVLPGSVALFAEAAKMSMTEFSQALEDGMFKGDAMKVLLENVATLMSTKFSDAATKASQTLQGQMNAMQNSLTLMYESLQPMVNAFAAAVGPVIQSMISDATEVIKAFTSNVVIGGEAFGLMTPRAQDFYSTLKELVPSIVAAAKNIGEFGKSLGIFVSPLVTAVKLVSDFIAIPFVGRVALYATIIGGLTTAFQLLVSTGIVQAIASMIRFMSTLSLVQISTWIAGIRSAIASLVAMARTADLAKLSLMALKVTLISFGVGAVLIGLDYVIQRLMGIGDAANKARQRAAELTDELNRAVEAGNTAMASERYVQAETRVQSIEKAQNILLRMQRARSEGKALPISQQEFETLQRTGLASGIDYRGGVARAGRGQIEANLETAQRGRIQALNEAGQAQEAMRDAAEVAINRQRQLDAQRRQLQDIPPGGGDEKAKKGKRTPLKQILDFESQRQSEMALSEKMLRLSTLIRDAKLSGNEAEAKSLKSLSSALKITNEIQAAQKFVTMLIDKEAEIVGKSLTQKEFTDKLEDAKVELYKLQNDLQIEFNELQVKEADAAKDAQDELNKKVEKQKELNRLIEDAQIAAGITPPQQAAIIQQRRGFEDAVTRAKEAGAGPEQLAQLTAAQALIPEAGSLQETIKTLREELDKLASSQELVKASALSIGDAFSKSFKDAITGASSAQEALAGFFQSVASSFADMAAQMIQKMIQIYILDQFLNILPGAGSFAGGAKIGQSVGMPTGVGIGAGGGILQNAKAQGFGTFGPNFGIRQFANGGIVTGPTMGLIGEGRYNEAVVPLPDGKSIPVDLGGGMGDSGVNIVVNVDAKGTNVQGDNQMGKQLGGAISAAVQAELIKQKRPGGLLAR